MIGTPFLSVNSDRNWRDGVRRQNPAIYPSYLFFLERILGKIPDIRHQKGDFFLPSASAKCRTSHLKWSIKWFLN